MTKVTVGIAGISFALESNPDLKYEKIEEGSSMELIAEPTNSFDSKAIRLEYKGLKLGYVPRKKEGVSFVIQSWCHENFSSVTAKVEQVWYKKDGVVDSEHSEGSEIIGVDVCFNIPKEAYPSTDVIITKHSFSEPNVIVDFNDTQHIYNMRCENGEYKVLQGGTTFIKRFFKPFDAERISRQCSRYWGVPAEEISEMWNSNGMVAAGFGTVVHAALEHYINFEKSGKIITDSRKKSGKGNNENYAMPKHPFLKQTIKSLRRITNKLDKEHNAEEIVAEALITDSATGWGGLVDRLCVIDSKKKIARIQDYKVNINAEVIESHSKPLPPFNNMPANKLTKYALQMSFYGGLLQKHGWTIDGLDVFIFEDKWVHHELPIVDFSVLKNKKKELKQGNLL